MATTTTVSPAAVPEPTVEPPVKPEPGDLLDFASLPDSSTITAPVLWEGTLMGPDGKPSVGAVTAAIRPSGAQLDKATAAGEPVPATLPLARQPVDGTGKFALRAALPATLPKSYSDDEWINVLLVVTNGQDIQIATDAMQFDGAALTGEPRWLTTPSARLAKDELAAGGGAEVGTEALKQKVADDVLSPSPDRPADFSFATEANPAALPGGDVPIVAADGASVASYTPPSSPYIGCTNPGVVSSSDAYQNIAEFDQTGYWQGEVTYSSTSTSSFEVGYSTTGASPWTFAGSASFSDSFSNSVNSVWPSPPDPAHTATSFQVLLTFYKIQWTCNKVNNPSTYTVYTSEAVAWKNGQYQNTGSPTISCNGDFYQAIAGSSTFTRSSGLTITWAAAGGAFGFYGKSSVSTGSFSSIGYHNALNFTRSICGETGHPSYDNTRAVSTDVMPC